MNAPSGSGAREVCRFFESLGWFRESSWEVVPGLVRGGSRARFGGGAGARFGGGASAHFWCRVPGPGTTLGQLFLRNSSMLVCVVPGARGRL